MSSNPFITPFDSLPSTLPIFQLPGTDHHPVITLVPLHDKRHPTNVTVIPRLDRGIQGYPATFSGYRGQAAV